MNWSRVGAQLWSALQVLLAIALLVVVATFVVQAAPWLVGADHSYVVLSGSMQPTINPGDSVLVGHVDPSSIHTGEIVTFRRKAGQPPVTHRVIKVLHSNSGGVAFKTKGDANQHRDPWTVHGNQVIGHVIFTVPYIGYLIEFANRPLGRIAAVGVPFGLLAVTELGAYALGGVTGSGKDSLNDKPHKSESADAAGDSESSGTADVIEPLDGSTAVESDKNALTPSESADPSTFTITSRDTQISSVVLAVFACYAAYESVTTQSPVSVAVTVGVVVVLAGALAMVFSSEDDSDATPARTDDGDEHDAPVSND